jgi:hypothetical protein
MTSALLLVSLLSTGNEPHWLTNYEEARRLARATGKPIFVVFRCEH